MQSRSDELTQQARRCAEEWRQREFPLFEALHFVSCTCRCFQAVDHAWLAFLEARPEGGEPFLCSALFLAWRGGEFVTLSLEDLVEELARSAQHSWEQRGYQVRQLETEHCFLHNMQLVSVLRTASKHDECYVLQFAAGTRLVYTTFWFHHRDEDAVEIEVIDTLQCPYTRYMRHNNCAILAMQRLLDDPTWEPRELAEIVRREDGLPSNVTFIIAKYAPVRVWGDTPFAVYWKQSSVLIRSGQDDSISSVLRMDEKVAVSYLTAPNKGHFICCSVRDLTRLKKPMLYLIHKKKQEGDTLSRAEERGRGPQEK